MFDDTKQAELAGWAWEMRRKGARVVISNSDPHNTNPSDNFFDDLLKINNYWTTLYALVR